MRSFNKLIAICYVGWAFDFYDLALFSFLLVPIGQTFGLTTGQEAWLLGSGLGASGLGGILFGWIADRYGRKPVLSWTILVYSIGTALSAFAPNSTVFWILRALTGLGIGGEWAIGHALVAESAPQGRRGRAAALLQSGEPVGVALAAIVGFVIVPHVGWRVVLFASGFTAFWAFAVRAGIPESPLWRGSGDPAKALRWLRSPQGLSISFRALLLAIFKLGTYWTCYVWLPKFFVTRFHEPIGRSVMWILTAQVGQFIGMMGFGRISDELGRRQAFTIYSLLTAAALAVLAFGWETLLLGHRFEFWLAMAALGVGSGCTAGFGAILAELYPTEIRNFAMGATYNCARSAQLFAPAIVAMALRWDVTGALCVPMILALATASWVWTLPETRGTKLEAVL